MSARALDPTYVRAQIDLLRYSHPDIWDAADEVLLFDMLEAETGINELLTAVVREMHEAQASSIGLDSLIAEYNARRDRHDRRADAMRALALKVMQHADVKKIELLAATLSIRTNTTPKVIITDEAALPTDCFRVKREPDKVIIRDRLRDGMTVPGAELSNAEPSLTVRIK